MPRPLPQSGRYWIRRIKSAMGETPVRPLVELITNSADSYKRLDPKNFTPPGEIRIFYTREYGWVLDQAEGMSRKKLLEVIVYGGKTSGIEKGKPVRGHFGIGLKDAALALEDTHIITIKDGLLNEVSIYLDEEGQPMVDDEIRINEEVTFEDRKSTGIKNNGTLVKFKIPKEFYKFGRNKPDYVFEKLRSHYQLRKILSSPLYSVIFVDGEKDKERKLKYTFPTGETILEDEFYIEYGDYPPFEIKFVLKKADKPLRQRGEYRDGGVLLFFNEDAVLDCSLFGLDHDFYAEKFFGEAEIKNFAELLKRDEPVLSDERKGLDYTHPFAEKLKEEFYKRIKKKLEEEKRKDLGREAHIEIPNRNKAIGLINRMIKTELESMEGTSPPLLFEPPNGLGFYHQFLNIPQKEAKNVYLVIDTKKFGGKKILINTDSPHIYVDPSTIDVPSNNRKRYIKEKVSILGEEISEDNLVTASCEDVSSSLIVTVYPNPKLNVAAPMSFLDDKITIVENKKKTIPLIFTFKPDLYGELHLKADDRIIEFQSNIPLKQNIIKITEDIYEIPITIKGLKAGLKTYLTASYLDKVAKTEIEVIQPREYMYHGLIKDFKESAVRNPKEISSFEDGIVYVHTNHPVMKHYIETIKKQFGDKYVDSLAYRMFRTNIIVERICKQIALEKEKRGILPKLYPNDPTAVEREFMELYFRYGRQFHNALCPLSRAIYIELEPEI